MMTTAEFLTMVANLPYVQILATASTYVVCYFDECYDENDNLTDEELAHFDELYDLMIVRGVRLTDGIVYLVDSADGTDSWDD